MRSNVYLPGRARFAASVALLAAAAVMAPADGANAQTRPQLLIVKAEADLAAETLLIQGDYFTWAGDDEALVTLGSELLTVQNLSASQIVASLPAGLPPGGYLLHVSRGSGSLKNDTFALTIGATGPPGPQGPQGETGAQGVPGNLALAGRSCSAGEFVTGFDAAGNLICRVRAAFCGDGSLDAGEECDDGNVSSGDGCSAMCTVERAANVTDPCSAPEAGLDRDCGFVGGIQSACTSGAAVVIACDTSCGLGSCSGDPLIRVCEGHVNCVAALAIAANDDSGCGDFPSYCPRVAFTCPASGRYTAVWGPYASGDHASCELAVQ